MPTTLLLVPGLCCVSSELYKPLISTLRNGADAASSSSSIDAIVPIDLPSIAPTSELPNALVADILAVRSQIVSAIDRGQDVVVLAHSYGGTPTVCATSGLWKREGKEKEEEGNGGKGKGKGKAGVVKVLMMAAGMSLPGKTVAGDIAEYTKTPPGEMGAKLEPGKFGMTIYPDGFGQAIMRDLPPATVERWAPTLRETLLDACIQPVPETIPSEPESADVVKIEPSDWKLSYLMMEEDPITPKDFLEWLVGRARDAGAKIDIDMIKGGHCPHLDEGADGKRGKVNEVADWVTKHLDT